MTRSLTGFPVREHLHIKDQFCNTKALDLLRALNAAADNEIINESITQKKSQLRTVSSVQVAPTYDASYVPVTGTDDAPYPFWKHRLLGYHTEPCPSKSPDIMPQIIWPHWQKVSCLLQVNQIMFSILIRVNCFLQVNHEMLPVLISQARG